MIYRQRAVVGFDGLGYLAKLIADPTQQSKSLVGHRFLAERPVNSLECVLWPIQLQEHPAGVEQAFPVIRVELKCLVKCLDGLLAVTALPGRNAEHVEA